MKELKKDRKDFRRHLFSTPTEEQRREQRHIPKLGSVVG